MARAFDGCRLLATADAEAARERDAVRQTLRTYVFIGADMAPSVRDPNDTLRGTVSGLAAAVESWLQVESMDAATEASWRALLRRPEVQAALDLSSELVQDDIDALTTRVDAANTAINAGVAAIRADIGQGMGFIGDGALQAGLDALRERGMPIRDGVSGQVLYT